MKLRVNPQTGRLAELVPADSAYTDGTVPDGPVWFTYRFEPGRGLTVEMLSAADVAEWPEVVLAPALAEPEFAFVVACSTCDPHPLTTDVHERDRWHAAHDGIHDTARYAVLREHPDADGQQFAHGDEVTFHGSMEGDAADLVLATVEHAAQVPDSDGDTVQGYEVSVDGRRMLVPATALARA